MLDDLSEEDRKGLIYGAVLVCVALGILVAVFIGYIYGSKGYDKETLCEFDVVRPAHKILLVDTTDELTVFHSKYIENDIRELVYGSPMGSRFTVYLIEQEAGGISEPVFDMCKPNSGESMNIIYENPKLAQRKFEEMFQEPLVTLLLGLAEVEEQKTSPLVESVSDLFKLSAFDKEAGKRSIHLYSDLLQNSNKASVYRNQSLPDISSCESTNINIDEIFVHMLGRDRSSRDLQNKALVMDWAAYLGRCSSHVQFEKVRA